MKKHRKRKYEQTKKKKIEKERKSSKTDEPQPLHTFENEATLSTSQKDFPREKQIKLLQLAGGDSGEGEGWIGGEGGEWR